MTLKKLPVGLQDFEKLIPEHIYVDKTEAIYALARTQSPYFLSRPRRFGKSLLISTLDALFSGKRTLFKDLWIEPNWDWTQNYPVIRLDMGGVDRHNAQSLALTLKERLFNIAARHDITLDNQYGPTTLLQNLIEQLSDKQGQVVVLIDEYDKPLLDSILNSEVAEANRELLRSFYGILKAQDANLRFVFITGVTKFSKVSVFSGLNNLNDLTMTAKAASLLGYTREELDTYFAPHIHALAEAHHQSVDEIYAQIKHWYNGYRFSRANTAIYNPFSLLLLLEHHTFEPYWFSSGTPSFLFKLMHEQTFDITQFEDLETTASSFEVFELKHIKLIPTLYQTGYLTIKEYDPEMRTYHLGYPNYEVQYSFNEHLLRYLTSGIESDSSAYVVKMAHALKRHEFDMFCTCINDLLKGMPYDLYLKDEKHFVSLLYLMVSMVGLQIQAEVHTQQGRADAVIETKDSVFIFEFKRDQSAEVALKQIKEKRYYERYTASGKSIFIAGINFNAHTRLVDDCQFEPLNR